MKNIVEMVNVNGELETNGDKWKREKIRFNPCTIIPASNDVAQTPSDWDHASAVALFVCLQH